MDLYGRLLGNVLYPGWERLRGRDPHTVGRMLERTQYASAAELADLQSGYLRRLVRHAYRHTPYYRALWAAAGLGPEDIKDVRDLARLPVLDKAAARSSVDARMADAPPHAVVVKTTSGTTGAPLTVRYNAESRIWRDATRWRGYGWAGYRPGNKAFHYWGVLATPATGWKKWKVELDHTLRRDHYVDCGRRGPAELDDAIAQLRRVRPDVMLAYTQGAAALARHVNRTGARTWDDLPVICGAERLWPSDRDDMVKAFGPGIFESYGCREVMLIGHECDRHDGLHVSAETMIVEVIVREGTSVRAARPGEIGEVAVTDLHNLSQPLIRYLGGDRAMMRGPEPCGCGRTLPRIGPIDGRVTDTLRDGAGQPVNGLLFSILFVSLNDEAREFQIVQRASGDLTIRVVMTEAGARISPHLDRIAAEFIGKYLPGVRWAWEYLDQIPTSAAGKHHIVVVEPRAVG
ncbi:MAG: phenylacetate--CoA ligase family protein [Myxococcales bacterium]|nr:phenylacetate--CoA ligase family protein [Myxococcales bacterium]